MARQIEDTSASLEDTDELPVLTADAIRRLRQAVVPELTEIVPLPSASGEAGDADLTRTEVETEPAPEAEAEAEAEPASDTQRASRSEQAFLERIATLEAYIAGRSDHWNAMAMELEEKALRIAELERELEQRIEREENLSRQLRAEGEKTDNLREQLHHLNLRLEALGGGKAAE